MTLPAMPSFIERDPAVIRAALIEQLEASLGRTLQPAQIETILAETLAYMETLVRIAIQDAATQNLVAFSRAPALDYLGDNIGVLRIQAKSASCTIRFTLVAVQGANVVVPAGTRVQTPNGAVTFETDEELVILAGQAFGDTIAHATVAGVIGNGVIIGQVKVILDPVALVASAANTDATAGGAEIETDDAFRERIRQAPNQFSVAGSIGAYRFHTLAVSSLITDVSVTSPTPGTVRIYFLTSTGLPSAGLIADVLAALTDEKVRPLTDTVEVQAPTEELYQIEAVVRPLVGADGPTVLADAIAATNAYKDERAAGIGRDIVPSALIAALTVAGVYDVGLILPAALIEVSDSERARCTDVDITLGPSGGG
ncbi:MAG: baseplate J/gp47 family protein [Gemmatimonadaceae bacterium]